MNVDDTGSAGQFAGALLELVQASGIAATVAENLAGLNKVLQAEPKFLTFLKHPSISGEEKMQMIKEVFKDNLDPSTRQLMELLIERRKMHLLPRIEHEFRELLDAEQNIVSATLISAEPMESSSVDYVRAKLARKMGKTVKLDPQVDKSLIGGYILRVGDEVIDGSLKGRLSTIEKSLLSV